MKSICLFPSRSLRKTNIGFTPLCSLVIGLFFFACLQGYGTVSEDGVYNVLDYGAAGDGTTKDTLAVQKAIDACHAAGGGTVDFPKGIFLCGSIHLKSNVTLHINTGAVIRASKDEGDFDPYEKLDFENDSDKETSFFHYSLLWGEDVENVAITGRGTVDGNREKRGGPKPIAFKRCRQLAVKDITILNAPNYCISLLGCDFVNIDGVTILNAFCDGIDPDSCSHVRISNCHIESWDDAIVLKSSFSLGELRPTEHVTVTNCVLSTSCNAFKLGTESGGGFRYISASNLTMFSPQKRRTISGIALESVDGAITEAISVSNVTMRDVDTPIFLRLGNRGRDMETPYPGTLEDISISHVVATGAKIASSITGLPQHPVEQVALTDINIEYQGGGAAQTIQADVPELPDKYPEAKMFGELPAYGLYCRHVHGLKLRDVNLRYAESDARPALICDDTDTLQISGLHGQRRDMNPFAIFKNVRNALLTGNTAPLNTGVYLAVEGEKTGNVCVLSNNLNSSAKAFVIAPDVPEGAFYEAYNRLPD